MQVFRASSTRLYDATQIIDAPSITTKVNGLIIFFFSIFGKGREDY